MVLLLVISLKFHSSSDILPAMHTLYRRMRKEKEVCLKRKSLTQIPTKEKVGTVQTVPPNIPPALHFGPFSFLQRK